MEPTQTQVQEPEGIGFFSIRTGETHYCKLEPTISAYINSSDMGINASREQDYGWRLDPEWVKRVRLFKRDRVNMSILTTKNQGQKPTTVQILYFMYGEELANYYESMEENENPFEEAYLAAINSGQSIKAAAEASGMPQALADFRVIGDEDDEDDIADLIDEVIVEEESAPVLTPEEQKAADDIELAKMEAEEKAKNSTAKPAAKKATQK